MGTTTAIARLQQKTPELVGVIKDQQKAMDEAMSGDVAKFVPFVDAFYAPGHWDRQMLGRDVRQDVQQESTFTLDMISGVITAIADNILKGDIGSLIGADPATDTKKVTAAVAKDITAVPTAASFMVEAAVAAISSVMGLFNSRATSHVGIGMESHRVGPGLSLHAYSYSATIAASAATGDDSILMTAIGYQLIYSFAQAEVEQGMALMEYYTTQLKQLEKALELRQGEIDKLIADPSTTMEELTKAQNFMTLASTQLETYKEKAHALAQEYAGK